MATIIMHVNYVEQGQTIDEMCERAARWGFDGIEFRHKRANVEETPAHYLDAIATASEKHGLKQVCFGAPGPDLMNADAATRDKEIDDFVAFYRLAAKRFDMTVNNTFAGSLENTDSNVPYSDYSKHGSFIATENHYAWAAEGYKVLGELAADLGFVFAFETHGVYLHDIPASTMKLVNMIDHPAVGVNLDYANITRFPNHPSLSESLDTIGDKLYYVHLKNSCILRSGEHLDLGLAGGQINNREFLRLLKDRGYDGPVCIEAPRPGDREWFAQQDLAYVKSVLEDIGY